MSEIICQIIIIFLFVRYQADFIFILQDLIDLSDIVIFFSQ